MESEQLHQLHTTSTEVEDLRKKHKRRRGKNRVAPLVTTTPPVSQSHNKPTSGYFVRRNNRVGVTNNNNNSNGSGTGSQTMVQSISLHSHRRGSVTGSEASDNNVQTISLENVDSSETGSLQRVNLSKRGSLASVELPAITAPPPQYHVNTVQHQYAFYSASTYTGGALPGEVPGAFEMSELEVDPEPTFTSVTPIDTELQSTPVFKRRVLGRRSSVSSVRSASSGHSHSRSNSRSRAPLRDHTPGHAISKRFVVHTPKNAMNVTHGRYSDDMPDISGCD